MTKITQLAGNLGDEAINYVGPSRELRVDLSNWWLRLHDGVTPGGRIFLDRDSMDVRYQARQVELDGFDFPAEGKGFVVRTGPGEYRLRSLTVNAANMTVQYTQGLGGNPVFSLKTEITSAHTWTAVQTFSGGLNGNLTGNTNGTHTGQTNGLHVGNVNGNVTGNLLGNSTGAHVGDVDVRGETLLLDDGQIPLAKLAGLLAFIKANASDPGDIKMIAGDGTAIPAGWFICDGNNGTPDLRDKFILAACGGDAEPHEFGGTLGHSHTGSTAAGGSHSHNCNIADFALTTAHMPAHKHGNGVTDKAADAANQFPYGSQPSGVTTNWSINNDAADGDTEGFTTTDGGGAAHGHPGSTTAAAGSHSHVVTVDSVDTVPPFYALCFIMKGY